VKHAIRISAVFLCFAHLSGCGTLPSGNGWGEEATIAPGWERVGAAARTAATDPWVWGPLVGVAVFQLDNWDREVSDWAREHTPVFGSQQSAEQWSDDLRSASVHVHHATLLLTPSGDEPKEWLLNKAKGALVQIAAVEVTSELTVQFKELFDRERPNGLALESFPSGHTSSSAVHTRLASRNLRSVNLSSTTRTAADIGLYALTLGTSWARIEAGWHYPSDTLAAMALGNFIASFVNDAFLGLESGSPALVGLVAMPDGVQLRFQAAFK
jgi:hypothetical protein